MRVKLPDGAARRPRTAPPKEIIRCPSCGSHRLFPEIAFIGGAKYLCDDCGFRGSFVVKGIEPSGPAEGGPAP